MNGIITLTQEERDKFAARLEQDAHTTEGILEQMEKLNVPNVLKQGRRIEMMAERVVAKILRSTETVMG